MVKRITGSHLVTDVTTPILAASAFFGCYEEETNEYYEDNHSGSTFTYNLKEVLVVRIDETSFLVHELED